MGETAKPAAPIERPEQLLAKAVPALRHLPNPDLFAIVNALDDLARAIIEEREIFLRIANAMRRGLPT